MLAVCRCDVLYELNAGQDQSKNCQARAINSAEFHFVRSRLVRVRAHRIGRQVISRKIAGLVDGLGRLLGFAFRQSLLGHLIGAFSNLVINLFDLQSKVKVMRRFRILLE